MGWKERPVFGKIRCMLPPLQFLLVEFNSPLGIVMNLAGCRRKFDVDAYVARWLPQKPKNSKPVTTWKA
jgi:hypothetical protein